MIDGNRQPIPVCLSIVAQVWRKSWKRMTLRLFFLRNPLNALVTQSTLYLSPSSLTKI